MDRKIVVNSQSQYELSPYLYMQFMEPLGATDGSVAAAWDLRTNDWREDVIEATRELAPSIIRFGGCLSSYYRWREGIGSRNRRKPMDNLLWGGVESNQVGTHEFVDFCRRTEADAFFCVNFASDGRSGWAKPASGGVRSAGPGEAAAWVDYCNNPDNKQRIANGAREPFNLKLWQLGNETSYPCPPEFGPGFDCVTAARKTVAFARAMRKVDSRLKLIGWGDPGRSQWGQSSWAKVMLETAGEYLDLLAFHHMFAPDNVRESPLKDNDWRHDPDATWEALMQVWKLQDATIRRMREETGDSNVDLALTESHFSLPGRNRCELLSTWAVGVADARILNVHERHGDRLKIATLADFCGTTWQVNALMIPMPKGKSYLMPVARVMSLYRKHSGDRALTVRSAPAELDVTASRKGKTIFLHVVNTHRTRSIEAEIKVPDMDISSARVFEIAVPPETEIIPGNAHLLAPVEKTIPLVPGRCSETVTWTFPPASVSAVELGPGRELPGKPIPG